MDVVEIFGCIQGEGLHTGKPTVFVRFGKCNLKCQWCDTAYHRDEKEFKQKTPYEIADYICAAEVEFITFTGGEPLIQPKAELLELIDWIHKCGKKVAIETNAVVFDKDVYAKVDFFSLSPKLQSAGVAKGNYNEGVAAYVSEPDFASKGQLKFVVMHEEDIAEVKESLEGVPYPITVIFQPCTDYNENPS